MSLFNLFQKKIPNNKLMLKMLKRGKSVDQCKAIDYLYAPDEALSKGCGGKKKKGGCFGSSAWDMDDYINHVDMIVNRLDLKNRALQMIGLDESEISEIPPIVLYSFQYKGDGVVIKSEESEIENIYRNVSNKYNVTWIFFSRTQIYAYTYYLNTISDNAFEKVENFFYKDITCIRTSHEVEECIIERKEGCGCFKKKESQYYHANQEYDALTVVVPDASYSFNCFASESVKESIRRATDLIRQKKNN